MIGCVGNKRGFGSMTDLTTIWEGLSNDQKRLLGVSYMTILQASNFREQISDDADWGDATKLTSINSGVLSIMKLGEQALSLTEEVYKQLPASTDALPSDPAQLPDWYASRTHKENLKAAVVAYIGLHAENRINKFDDVIGPLAFAKAAIDFTVDVDKALPDPKFAPVPSDQGQLGDWYQGQMGGENLMNAVVEYILLHRKGLVSTIDDLKRYTNIVITGLKAMYPKMGPLTASRELLVVKPAAFEKFIDECNDRRPRLGDIVRHLNDLNATTHGNPVCVLSGSNVSVGTFTHAMGCLIHARMKKEYSAVSPFDAGIGLVEMIDKAVRLIPVTGDVVPTNLKGQEPVGRVPVPRVVANIAPLNPSSSGVNKRKRSMDLSSAI